MEANLFEVTIACAALTKIYRRLGRDPAAYIYAAETASAIRRRVYGASEHILLLLL